MITPTVGHILDYYPLTLYTTQRNLLIQTNFHPNENLSLDFESASLVQGTFLVLGDVLSSQLYLFSQLFNLPTSQVTVVEPP